jgi:hypothetical protein
MTFTAAGQALAARVPAMLAGWDQALREAKTADSQAAQVLRVGFLAGAANEATQQIIAAFAHRRPGWCVEMRASRGRHQSCHSGLRPLLSGQQATTRPREPHLTNGDGQAKRTCHNDAWECRSHRRSDQRYPGFRQLPFRDVRERNRLR